MNFDDLSTETIREALFYCDYEDREEWITCGMALKSELGDAGRDMWLDWSSMASTYKSADAKSVWKSMKASGGVTIGSLIHLAKNQGYTISREAKPISKHVQQERQKNRLEAKRQAQAEERQKQQKQAEMAVSAQSMWQSFDYCTQHPYLAKKDIISHGVKVGKWTYKDENDNFATEHNALIVPLYDESFKIVSLQAIFPTGVKKMLGGAKKSGSFFTIGDVTDTILICEGYATGCTLQEATQLYTFVALDSGNLKNVAKIVRKLYPLSRVVICADNDQYGRTNTGIKSAIKAACEIDADIIYPKFKDISEKPTDFNDLYKQEGYSPIIDQIMSLRHMYQAVESDVESYSAYDLAWIEDAQKVFHESDSKIDVARAALTLALQWSKEVPAFRSIESIRVMLDHPLVHHKTHTSIMCRVLWSIYQRRKIALSAIRPESWGRKHNYVNVTKLDDYHADTPVSLICAPMGAGKTKNLIKPFSKKCKKFVAIAHRRSLIADLSKNLEISSYDDIKSQDQAMLQDKMAICLPSTKALNFKSFMAMVDNVAIDEISQNIRFTASHECKVLGADQESIFQGLQTIVSECNNVIACDASIDKTTIDFFEKSRPDETFTIVEQSPVDTGRKCFLYQERHHFLAKIDEELRLDGKVWLSVESAEKAEVLYQIYSQKYNGIVITAKNSKSKKIKEFLDSIETESLKYDFVIASPCISSGVSVEHAGKEHFTMIAGMASGHSVTFSDFAQMLGRVRYVKDYHIFLQKNNKKNDHINAQSILHGLRQAATIEGGNFRETEYSDFKAHIEATEMLYQADFANGLVWFLQYFCFKVEQGFMDGDDYSLSDQMKELTDEARERYIQNIMSAEKISKDRADVLQVLPSLDDGQFFELLAFKLRMSFCFPENHDISIIDISYFENLSKVDRFAAYLGLCHDTDETEKNISLRKFEKARIQACKIIFENINLNRITNADCDLMIQRVAKDENRFLLSALKLVPQQYGQWLEDKSGKLKQYQIPKTTSKSVSAILEKFGLSWTRSNDRQIGNYYKVSKDNQELIKYYAESRYKPKKDVDEV